MIFLTFFRVINRQDARAVHGRAVTLLNDNRHHSDPARVDGKRLFLVQVGREAGLPLHDQREAGLQADAPAPTGLWPGTLRHRRARRAAKGGLQLGRPGAGDRGQTEQGRAATILALSGSATRQAGSGPGARPARPRPARPPR